MTVAAILGKSQRHLEQKWRRYETARFFRRRGRGWIPWIFAMMMAVAFSSRAQGPVRASPLQAYELLRAEPATEILATGKVASTDQAGQPGACPRLRLCHISPPSEASRASTDPELR